MKLEQALGSLKDYYFGGDCHEIIVDGFNDVYIEKGGKIINVEGLFSSDQDILNLISNLMNFAGVEQVKGQYNYDFTIEKLTRVNVVLPPMSLNGPVLNMLKIPETKVGWEEYLKWNAIKENGAKLLKEVIKDNKNLLIAGACGSGKTTLLNLLADTIDKEQRVVTIERTPNLVLERKRTARLQAPNHRVDEMPSLVEAASKMRPDYIVHSYVEGPETMALMDLIREGHSAMALLSGENIFDAIKGLEFKALSCNYSRSIEDIRYAISSSFDYIVFQEKVPSGNREITRIASINYDEGNIRLEVLYTN